jgi:hypothetical protein
LLSVVRDCLVGLRDILEVLLNLVGLGILQDEARLFYSCPPLADRFSKVCIVLVSFTIIVGLEIERVTTWGKGVEPKAGISFRVAPCLIFY